MGWARFLARAGRVDIFKWALAHDVTQFFNTAKMRDELILGACEGGWLDLMRWLHARGFLESRFALFSSWDLAGGHGHLHILKWLDQSKIPPSARDRDVLAIVAGKYAVAAGHLDILQYLAQ